MNVRASADQRREARESCIAGQLVFVDFTAENASTKTHGIVLNISDAGMAVQTFRPLAQERTSEVHLLLRNSSLPLGQGLVAWKQQDGLAGIRLMDVSPRTVADLRHRLRKYVRHGNLDAPALLACRLSSGTNQFEVTLHLFACSAMEVTTATGAAIAIGHPNQMECRASVGSSPPIGTHVDPQRGLSGLSLSTGEIVYSGDLRSDPRVSSAISQESDTRSIVIIPIIADQDILGLLELFSGETDHFNDFHVKQLQPLVRVLGDALRNQHIFPSQNLPSLTIVPKQVAHNRTPEQKTDQTAGEAFLPVVSPPFQEASSESQIPLRIRTQNYWRRFSGQPIAIAVAITGVLLLCVIVWTLFNSGHHLKAPATSNVAGQSNTLSEAGATSTAVPVISFSPPTIKQSVGATFGVSVVMKGAKNLEAAPMQITYDPKKLQVLTVTGGDLLDRDGQAAALVQRVDPSTGRINVSISRPSSAAGISGDGTVFTVSFMCKTAGHSTLRVDHTGLLDAFAKAVPANSSEATVTISSPTNASQSVGDQGSVNSETDKGAIALGNNQQHNVPVDGLNTKPIVINDIHKNFDSSLSVPFRLPSIGNPAISRTVGEPATPSFALERTLCGHTNWVTAVAFSADGRRLLSGSWDQSLKLWDVSSGRALTTIASKSSGIQASTFSHNGRLVAAEDVSNNIRIWNADTGAELRTINGDRPPWDQSWGYSIAFSPDDTLLAAALDNKTVRLWDVNTGHVVHTFKGSVRSFIYVAFSPNGLWLATGGDSKSVEIWDLATGRVLRTMKGHKSDIFAVAFSPDGRLLASASKDKTVKLWEVATGRELYTLVGHQDSVTSVAFSRNGRWLATSGWVKSVRIWDVESGQQIQALTGHAHHIYSLAFDSGGGWLASGSEDGTIKLWRLRPEINLAVLNEDESKRTTASAKQVGRPK